METIQAAYDEVYVYAMDATIVQTATDDTKPIAIVFSLVGLYLYIEKQFSGKQVQKAHMDLARTKREWPNLYLPDNRGNITAAEVLKATAGPERDHAIKDWCSSVWAACIANREIANREIIVELSRKYQLV